MGFGCANWLLRLSLLCLFFASNLALAQGLARKTEIRPSFQAIYRPCNEDKSQFKLRMYRNTFSQSLSHSLSMFTSTEGLTNWVHSQGLTPYLYRFLHRDVTEEALRKCMPSQDEHHSFIRNLLIIDSAGRIFSLGGGAYLSFRALKALTPMLMGQLQGAPKILAKEFLVAGTVVGSAYGVSQALEKKVQNDKLGTNDPELIKSEFFRTLDRESQQRVGEIEFYLANQPLSEEDRRHLEKQKSHWLSLRQKYLGTQLGP